MSDSSLPPYTDAELVLGVVAPAGTNLDKFTASLQAVLREFDYKANVVRFSNLASQLAPDAKATAGSGEFQRLTKLRAPVRVPLLPNSYIVRESGAAEELVSGFGKTKEAKDEPEKG